MVGAILGNTRCFGLLGNLTHVRGEGGEGRQSRNGRTWRKVAQTTNDHGPRHVGRRHAAAAGEQGDAFALAAG